jgi:hypothetical protein
MQPAEQPHKKDDRNGNADQPQEETAAHVYLLYMSSVRQANACCKQIVPKSMHLKQTKAVRFPASITIRDVGPSRAGLARTPMSRRQRKSSSSHRIKPETWIHAESPLSQAGMNSKEEAADAGIGGSRRSMGFLLTGYWDYCWGCP